MNSGIARRMAATSGSAKGWGPGRSWGFAAGGSQDERFGEVNRLGHAVVFDALRGFFIQEVKAQGIRVGLDFGEQPVAQEHPFLLPDLALKYTLLDPGAVVLTGLGHAAQAAAAGGFHSGDIVGDEDEHRDRREGLGSGVWGLGEEGSGRRYLGTRGT